MEEISPSPRGLQEPRYKASPINLFFEDLILDVMGFLDSDGSEKIQAMNLQRVFSSEASDWRAVVREVLHLSPNFDVAVLDLWYRNREKQRSAGFEYHPLAFAQDFVDHYLAEDSQIDVFTPETLAAAKARVQAYRRAGIP